MNRRLNLIYVSVSALAAVGITALLIVYRSNSVHADGSSDIPSELNVPCSTTSSTYTASSTYSFATQEEYDACVGACNDDTSCVDDCHKVEPSPSPDPSASPALGANFLRNCNEVLYGTKDLSNSETPPTDAASYQALPSGPSVFKDKNGNNITDIGMVEILKRALKNHTDSYYLSGMTPMTCSNDVSIEPSPSPIPSPSGGSGYYFGQPVCNSLAGLFNDDIPEGIPSTLDTGATLQKIKDQKTATEGQKNMISQDLLPKLQGDSFNTGVKNPLADLASALSSLDVNSGWSTGAVTANGQRVITGEGLWDQMVDYDKLAHADSTEFLEFFEKWDTDVLWNGTDFSGNSDEEMGNNPKSTRLNAIQDVTDTPELLRERYDSNGDGLVNSSDSYRYTQKYYDVKQYVSELKTFTDNRINFLNSETASLDLETQAANERIAFYESLSVGGATDYRGKNHLKDECGDPARLEITITEKKKWKKCVGLNVDIVPYFDVKIDGTEAEKLAAGALEGAFTRGSWVQALNYHYKKVTDEIKNLKLTINSECGEMAKSYGEFSSQVAEASEAADFDLNAQLGDQKNIDEIWKCDADALSSGKENARQSAQQLCAARTNMEAMFANVALCEIFTRAEAEYQEFLVPMQNQWVQGDAQLPQMIQDIRDTCTAQCSAECPKSCSAKTCITDCTKRCYREELYFWFEEKTSEHWSTDK